MQQGIPQLQINMPALGNPGNDDVLEHQGSRNTKTCESGLVVELVIPSMGNIALHRYVLAGIGCHQHLLKGLP